jgi:hypothetical protein
MLNQERQSRTFPARSTTAELLWFPTAGEDSSAMVAAQSQSLISRRTVFWVRSRRKPDADGIIFDEASGLVLIVSGDNGDLMSLKSDVDPKTGTIDPPIELGGKPEFLVSDGAGKVYVNLADKNEVAVVDIKARKVIAHWPVAPAALRWGCPSTQTNSDFLLDVEIRRS